MSKIALKALSMALLLGALSAFAPAKNKCRSDSALYVTRRNLLTHVATTSSLLLVTGLLPAQATVSVSGPEDGLLPDLPSEAVRSFLQYRVGLQVAADYYIFELQDLIKNPEDWGLVAELFRSNLNKGQGQPNRIERDFTNPMRILGLSMPPDTSDVMRDAQFKFETAMAKITKATAGFRRDLSVELDPKDVTAASQGWEEGRVAFNDFLVALNDATGLKELKTIPPNGPNQTKEYGRSARKYLDLMKKTKLCQNRGGPALSQGWGKLMVSGYLQDSCGIPDMEDYFYQ